MCAAIKETNVNVSTDDLLSRALITARLWAQTADWAGGEDTVGFPKTDHEPNGIVRSGPRVVDFGI